MSIHCNWEAIPLSRNRRGQIGQIGHIKSSICESKWEFSICSQTRQKRGLIRITSFQGDHLESEKNFSC